MPRVNMSESLHIMALPKEKLDLRSHGRGKEGKSEE